MSNVGHVVDLEALDRSILALSEEADRLGCPRSVIDRILGCHHIIPVIHQYRTKAKS